MELKRMHPLLPESTAAEYGHRAALGLERHRHESGVVLKSRFHRGSREDTLHWVGSAPGDLDQLGRHRITEDAAEAIALAFVRMSLGWVVRRRLQRGEFADWLLRDAEAGLVALEVSGVDYDGDYDRLRIKIEQVRRATAAAERAACVIELSGPRAIMATA